MYVSMYDGGERQRVVSLCRQVGSFALSIHFFMIRSQTCLCTCIYVCIDGWMDGSWFLAVCSLFVSMCAYNMQNISRLRPILCAHAEKIYLLIINLIFFPMNISKGSLLCMHMCIYIYAM